MSGEQKETYENTTEQDKNEAVKEKHNELPDHFDSKNKLKPSERYEANEYRYETDKQGRIKHCEGTLRLDKENKADPNAQRMAGGESRHTGESDPQDKDQGGHLIARRFGGSKKLDNLVAMNSHLNQSEYKNMENGWQKRLEDKNDDGSQQYKVDVDIRCNYRGDSERPSNIFVYSKVTDSEDNVVEKKIYHYHNEYDSMKREPRDLMGK